MLPQSKPRRRRNSSRVNLLISLVFHGVIILGLFYFAARQGLLGKQLKKIAVELVQEKKPDKPDEPEKPAEPTPEEMPPPPETPVAEAPRETPRVSPPPPADTVPSPPTVAPPVAQLPAFSFEGGRQVVSSADPVQLYKGLVEYALRANWIRPPDLADKDFVAEVEIAVDRNGRLSDPAWKKGSGNQRWDDSVRQAVAATRALTRPPPPEFPARVLVRFDVLEVTEEIFP